MTKVLSALLLTLLIQPALAQQPTPQTLERFLNAYQFEPVREAWGYRLDREVKAEIAKWRAKPGITPPLRAAIDKYEAALAAELQRSLSSESLRPRYAAIFGKVFNESEMLEITRFYESPAGKASVAKRPQIAALIQEQFTSIASEMEVNLKGARLELEKAANSAQQK
ncbi:DUF2059 domain-containing protein [Roseateles sp. P5_E11]